MRFVPSSNGKACYRLLDIRTLSLGLDDGNVLTLIRQGGRKALEGLKQKARRNGAWFKVLKWGERRYIDAVILAVERIQSPLLLRILTPLVDKLLRAIGGIRALIGEVSYRMIKVGRPLALRISMIAQAWGNLEARSWASDESFIKYLTIVSINQNPIWRMGV